jgi:chromosome segregation ATPase
VVGAIAAVEETLDGYNSVNPILYKKVIGELSAIKASLYRAKSLAKELEILATRWRPESLDIYQKARKLEEATRLLAKAPEGTAGKTPPAVTDLTHNLKEKLGIARQVLEGQKRWRNLSRLLIEEMDSLKAALEAGSEREADWGSRVKSLESRLSDLEGKRSELSLRRQESDRRLANALAALEEAENGAAGDGRGSSLKRWEGLAASVDVLLKSTLARRTELAEAWWSIGALVGRPVYLDRIYLYAAINFGRTQSLLEELRSRLTLNASRLSSSQELRKAARAALAVDRETGSPALLRGANRRLDDLKNALKSRSSAPKPPERPSPVGLGTSATVFYEELYAVASERDRLKEELLALKDRLSEAGQVKARFMKLVEWARRHLKEVSQEKTNLTRQLTENQERLALIRRRHANLIEQYKHGQNQFQKLLRGAKTREGQLKDLLSERNALASQMSALDLQTRNLEEENKTLTAKGQELALNLDQARGQEAALAAELAGHQEELAEATANRESLGLIITGYRKQLDRLIVAHQALLDSHRRRELALAQSDLEREEQKIRLAKSKKALIAQVTKRHRLLAELGTYQARLEGLENERARLSGEIEAARAEAERAKSETDAVKGETATLREKSQNDLKAAKEIEERLKAELAALHSEMDHNLKPLIELLGLALWRGEAATRVYMENSQEEIARLKKEGAAREAGIRIQGATKEIQYLERLNQKEKDLTKLTAERDALEGELNVTKEGAKTDSEEKTWVVNQLSVALVASDLRHEKLTRGLRNLKNLLNAQRAEAASVKSDLEDLVQNQAQALKKHQAWLSELVPLVGFFLESGLDFWTQGPIPGDARQAVLFFLREENANLAAELDRVREDRQGLWAERKSLLETQAGFKEKLNERRDLIAFLIQKFVENTLSLAEAWNQRDTLLVQITALHAAKNGPSPLATEAENQAELTRVLGQLSTLEAENNILKGQMDRAEVELERQRNQAKANNEEKAASEERFATQKAQIARLAKKLADQDKALADLRSESRRLTGVNQSLSETADRQAAELAARQKELEALKDQPNQDGQVVAALAAINYMGARSADSLSALRNRLDQEARKLEELQGQLRNRDDTIQELEKRQDSLALLFWTVVQMSADGQLNLPAPEIVTLPPPLVEDDNDESGEDSSGEDKSDQDKANEGKPKKTGEKGLLMSGLLNEIRKAAKKSLFGLVLAGGLVLNLPTPGQATPLLLGTPQTPMVGLEAVSVPTWGPNLAAVPVRPEPGLRPLGHFSGEPRWESDPSPKAPFEALATRAVFRRLSRVIDLSFLPVEGPVDVEAAAMDLLTKQARDWNLDKAVWMRLVRGAYDRDKTVFLTDLNDDNAVLVLARPYLPQLTRMARRSDCKRVLGLYLLKSLDGLSKTTADFWDRLFMDFFQRSTDLEESALGLAWHLSRRADHRLKMEYGGRLGLSKALDHEPPDRVQPHLAAYIQDNWPALPFRKKGGEISPKVATLAADICATSSIFGTPWTFMAILAEISQEKGSPWPRALEVYGANRWLASEIEKHSQKWSETQPAICDLDLLALSWSQTPLDCLLAKKKKLADYYVNKVSPNSALF